MDDNRITTYGGILILLAWLGCCILGGCNVNSPDADRILKSEGVTNIQLYGHAWLACSTSDSFSTKFSGVRNGVAVKGAVCGGWLKDYTVRYE